MENDKISSIKTTARIAGFLYLFQIPLGVFGILYVPNGLMVPGIWQQLLQIFWKMSFYSDLAL